MAKFNYTSIQNTASKMIDKFGTDGIIRRTANDTTVTNYAVRCVITNYQPRDRSDLIFDTDRRILIAAKGMTIVPDKEQDRFIVGGENLRIVTVTKTAPGGSDIIYEIQVRL